mmetsp:Transcript_2067/g.2929  ORF Transcript_2067/g.2929 Transcript_2067/m.2929 type:complete len:254 (-) Transcript_2067:36-797(-)
MHTMRKCRQRQDGATCFGRHRAVVVVVASSCCCSTVSSLSACNDNSGVRRSLPSTVCGDSFVFPCASKSVSLAPGCDDDNTTTVTRFILIVPTESFLLFASSIVVSSSSSSLCSSKIQAESLFNNNDPASCCCDSRSALAGGSDGSFVSSLSLVLSDDVSWSRLALAVAVAAAAAAAEGGTFRLAKSMPQNASESIISDMARGSSSSFFLLLCAFWASFAFCWTSWMRGSTIRSSTDISCPMVVCLFVRSFVR